MCTIIETAGANPALLAVTGWNPGAAFQALFPTTRRAKFKARRCVLGGGWGGRSGHNGI